MSWKLPPRHVPTGLDDVGLSQRTALASEVGRPRQFDADVLTVRVSHTGALVRRLVPAPGGFTPSKVAARR